MSDGRLGLAQSPRRPRFWKLAEDWIDSVWRRRDEGSATANRRSGAGLSPRRRGPGNGATGSPTARHRVTVGAKIYAVKIATIVVGVLCMLYVYRGMVDVRENLHRLDEVEVPFSTAAFEMEVNSEEYALGVLKYLAQPDRKYRAEADDDSADFSRGFATYLQLSTDEQKRRLGVDLAAEHRELVVMGNALMQLKDRQENTFLRVTNLLEEIDETTDDQLPQLNRRREPLQSKVMVAILDMETEAAEIGFWLANYERRPTAVARREVSEKVAELGAAIFIYRGLALSATERGLSAEVQSRHATVAASIGELLDTEDALTALVERFILHQDRIDDVVDEEIQTMALESLSAPRAEADNATEKVLSNLRFLIPLFVVMALVGGLMLTLTVIRPLRRLAIGTDAIGKGDLSHRIEESGRDEFGDVAWQFNSMATQLQTTMVSKSALESSEQALKETVFDLELQIEERERSEREQEVLRSELKRSEAMAAMGSLTAGVAHEVRNPLFGISSTLDAMEAQPNANEAVLRYRNVLRREVDRLNKLMHDLLEFGRPTSGSFAAGTLRRVVDEAVRICAPVAEAAGVVIINSEIVDARLARLDRNRLTQVFVNLIENAVQNAPVGTEIITTSRTTTNENGERWIECTVQDSGSGFMAEDLPLIFDPFFTRRRKGTGLGLSIVQRIVDEHHGRIVADNRPEGGAIMTVRLPIEVSPK